MNDKMKIATVSHRIYIGDVKKCYESLCSAIESVYTQGIDLIVCPPYAFTGISCNQLFSSGLLKEQSEVYLEELTKFSKKIKASILVGIVIDEKNENFLIKSGQRWLSTNHVNEIDLNGGKIGAIYTNDLSDFEAMNDASNSTIKPDIILYATCAATLANTKSDLKIKLENFSKETETVIINVNLGLGETSSPYLYMPYIGEYELGKQIDFNAPKTLNDDLISCIYEANFDQLKTNKLRLNNEGEKSKTATQPKKEILKDPYIPQNNSNDYLEELFTLSATSLAIRLKNTGIKKLVVGISGGLDSTLAVLCCAKTADILGFSRSDIIAVTMPGFGTSNRTYQNALQLIEQLGCEFREVSIKQNVELHLKEIGYEITQKGVTYENAQARERTQILLDIANMSGGLVVGTGDLSEEALGFATFSGDHLSNFNVNVCYTKNMIRKTVKLLANTTFSSIHVTLTDILNTPVSPELLPPDENGEITQKTEVILGPYELHDFFLYYFIKEHYSPKGLVLIASSIFPEFTKEYIEDKLAIFFKKFFAGQFKRSCVPDCASLTKFNLANVNFSIPSDMSSSFFIEHIQ